MQSFLPVGFTMKREVDGDKSIGITRKSFEKGKALT